MDKQSSSGYQQLAGGVAVLGGSGKASAEHHFCFRAHSLERHWEIRKCSERKCRIIGGLENVPSSEKN